MPQPDICIIASALPKDGEGRRGDYCRITIRVALLVNEYVSREVAIDVARNHQSDLRRFA
jgi:hypothetical protein